MAQVPEWAMCQAVNHCFEKEGLPKRIKIDNGLPLVLPHDRDVPTRTVLWWIGLGIEVVCNKPRCPQQNGTVENLQGTCSRWSRPHECHSAQELQGNLDETGRIQRKVFRLRKKQGKTRQELYPQLDANPRRYTPEAFDYGRVKHYLAQQVWSRTVPACGSISFARNIIYVSNKLAGHTVTLTFDPVENQWVIRDNQGKLIKTSQKEIFSEKMILEIAKMSKNSGYNLD